MRNALGNKGKYNLFLFFMYKLTEFKVFQMIENLKLKYIHIMFMEFYYIMNNILYE